MSDSATVKDCLVHYDSRHIQVRRDFYELCSYNKDEYNQRKNEKGNTIKDEPDQECMAKILRILETLTDDQRKRWHIEASRLEDQGLHPKEPKEYPVPLTYGYISHLLYNTHGDSAIRNSIAVLLERKYIKRFQETINSVPYYVLNIELLQKLLQEQAEHSLEAVEINTQTGEPKRVLKSKGRLLKSTPKRPHSTANALKSTPPAVEINTTNNSNNSNTTEKEKELPFGDFTNVQSPQNDSHLQFTSPLPVAMGDTKDDDLQTDQGEGFSLTGQHEGLVSFPESMARGNAVLEDPDDTVKMGAIRPPRQESEATRHAPHCDHPVDLPEHRNTHHSSDVQSGSATSADTRRSDTRSGDTERGDGGADGIAAQQTTPPAEVSPAGITEPAGIQQVTRPSNSSSSLTPGQRSGMSDGSTLTVPDTVQVEQEKPKKPSRATPLELPTMPPIEAPWDAESIVQVAEAHQGRRYPNGAKRKSDRIRDKELEAAKVLLSMRDLWTETPDGNRARLLSIIEHTETRHENWWLDNVGYVFPHHLVDKDRVHTMWAEMERIKRKSNGHSKPEQNGQSREPLNGYANVTPLRRGEMPPPPVYDDAYFENLKRMPV